MNVRTLCLAILNFGDTTGYEIRKHSLEGAFSYFVDASFGSIYPALSRLEEDGLVTSRAEAQSGKPDRKVYSITDAGRAEFRRALMELPQPDTFKSEFLLLAICAPMVPASTMRMAIDERVMQLKSELEVIRSAASCGQPSTLNWAARCGEACVSASLNFLRENRYELEANAIQDDPPAEAAE